METIVLQYPILVDGQVISKGETVIMTQENLAKAKDAYDKQSLRVVLTESRGDTETVLATTNDLVVMMAGTMGKLVEAISTADNLAAVKKAAEESKSVMSQLARLADCNAPWVTKGSAKVVDKAIAQSQAVTNHIS